MRILRSFVRVLEVYSAHWNLQLRCLGTGCGSEHGLELVRLSQMAMTNNSSRYMNCQQGCVYDARDCV